MHKENHAAQLKVLFKEGKVQKSQQLSEYRNFSELVLDLDFLSSIATNVLTYRSVCTVSKI